MNAIALERIVERERQTFLTARPKGTSLGRRAAVHFAAGVPMHWMRDWPLPSPLYVRAARDAVLTDVDGHDYVDFCLGDTGAMFGHSPPSIARVIATQSAQGLTTMLPSEQVAAVGEGLAAFFGLKWWQITQTATDANRAVLRLARMITGRPRVLVFDGCYHGTVDETMAVLDEQGATAPRPGQIGRIHDPRETTVVVEFNDIAAVEQALARGDIACVLAEPVMTNAGMVLPAPGFLESLRAACTRHEVPLVIDETHTLSSGPGGYARMHGIAADFLVCGKAIAGGLPCAVFGHDEAIAARILAADAQREAGHSGVGTTLSANPLALAALAASLAELMTPANYQRMAQRAMQLSEGIEMLFRRHALGWQVSRVGARLEFGAAPAPRTGRQSLAAIDHPLLGALHLYLLNRGFLLTPFHNMMLCSPVTTPAQVEAFLNTFDAALDEFSPLMRAA
ncbi:MAG TPA: transaminase [Steroidobacteraceae bacterium]|nr:transaminase [Steroidobacteraceae bacterium]